MTEDHPLWGQMAARGVGKRQVLGVGTIHESPLPQSDCFAHPRCAVQAIHELPYRNPVHLALIHVLRERFMNRPYGGSVGTRGNTSGFARRELTIPDDCPKMSRTCLTGWPHLGPQPEILTQRFLRT